MWGLIQSSSSCPNCGNKDWEDKKGFECRSCGFKKPDPKELPELELYFCPGCGCHYLGGCNNHPPGTQIYIKPQVPNK